MKSYDPNDARDFKYRHVFKLTFQQWGYIYEAEAEVGGNCSGFENLDSAISTVWENLPGDGTPEDYPIMTMTNPETGEALVNDGVVLETEDDIKNMLVKAEIISLVEVSNENEATDSST